MQNVSLKQGLPDLGQLLLLSLLMLSPGVVGQPPAAKPAVPIETASIKRFPIFNEVDLVGTVTSPRVATLSTEINGLVKGVLVDDGDKVMQGDSLLTLDSELAKLQLDSAKASVEQASNALTDAKRRLKEAIVLSKDRSIAQSTVRDIEAEVQLDQSGLSKAKADAAYQQAIYEKHTLRSPFSGVISRKLIEAGEWVSTGLGVFELVATDNLRLDFNVAEDYLAKLAKSATISFSLSIAPEKIYEGYIDTLVPVSAPNDRTVLLRAGFDQAQFEEQLVIPGLSVKATLQIPTGRSGLVVSRDAILRNQDGRVTVWTVVEKDGEEIVKENVVTTGLVFAKQIEILSGLAENDQVVVVGNESLRDGQRVKVVNN